MGRVQTDRGSVGFANMRPVAFGQFHVRRLSILRPEAASPTTPIKK